MKSFQVQELDQGCWGGRLATSRQTCTPNTPPTFCHEYTLVLECNTVLLMNTTPTNCDFRIQTLLMENELGLVISIPLKGLNRCVALAIPLEDFFASLCRASWLLEHSFQIFKWLNIQIQTPRKQRGYTQNMYLSFFQNGNSLIHCLLFTRLIKCLRID